MNDTLPTIPPPRRPIAHLLGSLRATERELRGLAKRASQRKVRHFLKKGVAMLQRHHEVFSAALRVLPRPRARMGEVPSWFAATASGGDADLLVLWRNALTEGIDEINEILLYDDLAPELKLPLLQDLEELSHAWIGTFELETILQEMELPVAAAA